MPAIMPVERLVEGGYELAACVAEDVVTMAD